MHNNLAVYDAALEVWDPRSYEAWEQDGEDEQYLECERWLEDVPIYIYREKYIQEMVLDCYNKI
jgi:hypothetical protein